MRGEVRPINPYYLLIRLSKVRVGEHFVSAKSLF